MGSKPPDKHIRVYYNSACPVCNAGIDFQRRRMAGCADTVEWKDVHLDATACRETGVALEDVRERLHVIDSDGELCVGAAAFAAIWRHSPGERWKARLIELPVIRTLAAWSYNVFARLLYRWNRYRRRW